MVQSEISMPAPAVRTLLVFVAFVAVAAIQAWPLPLHLATHLTGSPTGDTGVYVWNLWIFSHQIFSGGTTPLSTFEILPLTGAPTDLSLHNYTVFSNLLAMPLLDWLGVVRTFNLIFLFNNALVGFGMYLLARRLTGRTAESFLAGVMFACSPFIVTRGLGHFSLAAAAPLPLFMVALYRAWESQKLRDAVVAGAVLAWAAFSDPYYAVYCLMLGAGFLAVRLVDVSLVRRPERELRGAKNLLHVAIGVAVVAIAAAQFSGGSVQIGSLRLSMRSMYTPVLVLTVLVITRLALSANLRIAPLRVPSRRFVIQATLACGVAAAVLTSPTLYALGRRAVEGDVTPVPVLWRSSAPGVDLLSYLIPNPNHPLSPSAVAAGLAARPGGYLDQVVSLSFVGFAILFAAYRWAGLRLPRFWIAVTVGFGLLTLGPFVEIAGLNTHIPTPWALLRYAPVIGAARMPARFAAVTTMGFAVLLAFGLAALTRRFPARRLMILTTAGVALAAELIAAPLTLYSAAVPSVFQVVAADPRPVRVLELPTGVRDGVSSLGDFNAVTQYYQTFHGKGLIGGYLSRVAPSAKSCYRRLPVTSALMEISEGHKLTDGQIRSAVAAADNFVSETDLGYVVMNQARTSADLREFATILLGLTKVGEADGYELYVTKFPTGPFNSHR